MLNLLWRNKIYLHFLLFLNAEIVQVAVKSVVELKTKIRLFCVVNSSPPGQDGHYFADDIFSCIFVNEKGRILNKISLEFVPKGSIDNNQALDYIMAWRRIGAKPLYEPMLTRLSDAYTYICICGTRGRWVNIMIADDSMIQWSYLRDWFLFVCFSATRRLDVCILRYRARIRRNRWLLLQQLFPLSPGRGGGKIKDGSKTLGYQREYDH